MHRTKATVAMIVVMTVIVVFGSAAASASSGVLKKESQGSEVTALQKDLIKLGYLDEDATGYYGNATEAAVKKVQKEYGYEADGIAGEVTLSLIDRLRGRSSSGTSKSGASATTKTVSDSSAVSSKLLKEGDENSSVTALQKKLINLGYLDTNATGYYGPATAAAVKSLQKKHGYISDGIAGSATLALVDKLVSGSQKAVTAKAASAAATPKTVAAADTAKVAAAAASSETKTSDVKSAESTAESTTAAVTTATSTTEKPAENTKAAVAETPAKTQADYMLKWFGNVEKKFANGDTATVYDIETGLSFKIKRTYGHNHADCETLTTADTAVMKKIYGTWSWERRAIIVSVDGLKIAACMTGYPHAGLDKYAANKTVSSRSGGYGRGTNLDAVKKNNMNGVFDIHFLGSKNHYNNKVDPKHQALIKEAAKWAEENYK